MLKLGAEGDSACSEGSISRAGQGQPSRLEGRGQVSGAKGIEPSGDRAIDSARECGTGIPCRMSRIRAWRGHSFLTAAKVSCCHPESVLWTKGLFHLQMQGCFAALSMTDEYKNAGCFAEFTLSAK